MNVLETASVLMDTVSVTPALLLKIVVKRYAPMNVVAMVSAMKCLTLVNVLRGGREFPVRRKHVSVIVAVS